MFLSLIQNYYNKQHQQAEDIYGKAVNFCEFGTEVSQII
jgi:hypothetical protein